MGFLVVLIPIACCVAIPAGLVVWAFVGSRKRNKLQDNPEPQEGAQYSLLGKKQRQ